MGDMTEKIWLSIEMTSVANYALQQNRVPLIREVVIHNDTAVPLKNVRLSFRSGPEIVTSLEQNIDFIPAESAFTLNGLKLTANGEYLAGLTERICGMLYITLTGNDSILVQETRELTALAFDEWHGTAFFPELLAAFVTPNHPDVAKICAAAAELLGKWTGDPSLDAYQTQDPNRVLNQAAAVYGALQAQNIVYSVPPASFETIGQRVRLCDVVIQQKMGTCLDLTLLYAACLEAIGLNPLLLLQKGHIFAGVWLDALSFPEAVQDDPALITKRLADGIGEIAVVECTAFVSGKNIDFDGAMSAAVQKLGGTDTLEYIIDVGRARLSGIRPLPLRIHNADGWSIVKELRPSDELTSAPSAMGAAVTVTEEKTAETTDKLIQWERKLLDLGLRNTLVNMRLTQSVIPILSPTLGDLEDALADGSEYGIGPHPMEWKLPETDSRSFEAVSNLGPIKELIKSEFQNKRLRSVLSESELGRAVVNLYRSSKASLEENGANTLYLALGLLRWYETKTSQKPRYAPIVLLPVEIVRKAANRGYVIRLRDEEPQMNITLLEMLKQDYGITVTGLDPLPLDEHGIDLRGVFSIMRKAVMDQSRWDIVESAFLGIFSFTQFVMWNDIRNRAEDLRTNKIVRSLIDGKLSWAAEPMTLGERVPEDGILLPIPADASQTYAISAAARGESFVLHGPPGTGKSQTITALIVNAVAQGKTVLFVAEKMAALSVVQKRLNALGIGPFCLELHSNKSKKRDILEQLRQATEVTHRQSAEVYLQKAEQSAALRRELDAYAQALHKTRRSGLSLFDMIGRYEKYRDSVDVVTFYSDFSATADSSLLERQKLLVERLIASAKAVGHPAGHPLCHVARAGYSQQLRVELPDKTGRYLTALETLGQVGNRLAVGIGLHPPVTQADWEKLRAVAGELAVWFPVPRAWAGYSSVLSAMRDIQELSRHSITASELRDKLTSGWTDDFLHQDGAGLLTQWDAVSAGWFLPKLLGRNKLAKAVTLYSKTSVQKETLRETLSTLATYQSELAAANRLLDQYKDDLGALYAGTNTNWSQIGALTTDISKSSERLASLTGGDTLRKSFAAVKDLVPAITEMVETFDSAHTCRVGLYNLLDIRFTVGATDDWLDGQKKLCQVLSEHTMELKDWMAWKGICEEAKCVGLETVVQAYDGGLGHAEITGAYFKALYMSLIIETVEHDEALNTFSGSVFSEKVEQFKRLDRELMELTKSETFCRLAAKVPNFTKEAAQSSEVGILQRAIRSGGRGVSIRKLFDQIPNLLPRLCPCMLMSPISAAQYLDPKRPPFDIVVFDEASQMPTCKAVGALARGRDAVIVGDPKQMPPTSFFAGNATDEENLDCEDLESILDDCLALNMPETHLLWHYRSRHESLIAFSNSQFYENRLFTFPSVNDLESKVSLIRVDGVFDRGKTRQNRKEAEAIVQELICRSRDPLLSRQSVGVVTFNISQQNLIDDLFTEACKGNAALESWAYEAEEPLFIKNLENVQGDERDVILFSIGYGPDADGRVFMNFGPLNREGGWRRLNVAVSRARQEMMVFSTLTADQINLSRTSATGVAALKAFLEYAGGVALSANWQSTETFEDMNSGIAESICRELDTRGYQAHKLVGHSEYRLDIGVVDSRQPERYLLGILLDGPVYGKSKTTRDREISQITVLNGLGWEIHRIWAMDWWDNGQKEISALLAHLNAIEKRRDRPKTTVPEKAPPTVEVIPLPVSTARLSGAYREPVMPTSAVKTYHAAVLPTRMMSPEEYLLPQSTRQIETALQSVIQAEAPISEGLLTRRVLQSFCIARAGARIQARTDEILRRMQAKSTVQADQKFYWTQIQIPETYEEFRASGDGDNRRDAKDVPVQEAANTACVVLKEQIGLPKEDLIREMSKLLGYARSGNVVVSAMSNGISLAIARGQISENESGYLSLKE
ncbi:MAG: DUF3320 domain-containing protein [Oscillospiraceae bacterium]